MSWRTGVYLGRTSSVETKKQTLMRPLLEDMQRKGEILSFLSDFPINFEKEDYAEIDEKIPKRSTITYRMDFYISQATIKKPLNDYTELDKAKYCLEIDGESHNDPKVKEKDRIRDKLFKEIYGIPTIRIKARRVTKRNYEKLRAEILEAMKK